MSTPVLIRPATTDDLPAIHGLVRELAAYERAEAECTATLEDYRRDFAAGIFDCLVAVLDGEVVGMALYYITYSTWKGRMLYLEDFVIREDLRRQGIGQQLFEAFLAEAKKRDCRLTKWQVLEWNEPAIKFYKKYAAVLETEWWNGKIMLSE